MTGENFVDEDEDQWIEKKKIKPPFALVYFKEFQTRILKGGRRKEHEGSIITYDAFPGGKADIRKWEKENNEESQPICILSKPMKFWFFYIYLLNFLSGADISIKGRCE